MKTTLLFLSNHLISMMIFVLASLMVACSGGASPSPTTERTDLVVSNNSNAYPIPEYPVLEIGESPSRAYPGQSSQVTIDDFQMIVGNEEWPLFPGKILFHSERAGQLSIYTLNGSDGSIDRITEQSVSTFEPAWSPDCESIVYVAGVGAGDNDFEIYTIDANGNRATKLFDNPNLLDWGPVWSPDKQTIAYQNNQDSLINICLFDVQTSTESCLERGNYSNANAEWSPNGSQLLFSSNRDGDWDIYIMDINNDEPPVQLTENKYTDLRPRYSPDGQFITFDSLYTGQFDIFVMDADGTNQHQITTNPSDDREPQWIGNDWIAFTSLRTTDGDIYIMRPDGSELKRVTDTIGLDGGVAWCPTP